MLRGTTPDETACPCVEFFLDTVVYMFNARSFESNPIEILSSLPAQLENVNQRPPVYTGPLRAAHDSRLERAPNTHTVGSCFTRVANRAPGVF